MKRTLVIILSVVAIVALPIVVFIGMYVSANNTANRYEKNIAAAHESSRNTLGQYAPKLTEALGVTKIQANAVRDIITASNESRYGGNGSQAQMQWIQEQNPNLDQSQYRQVLNIIEAGRNEFQQDQKRKIDEIRAYNTALGNMPGSFFMRLAGYPTPAFTAAKYDQIVVSGHAADSFETGIDNGVNTTAFQ